MCRALLKKPFFNYKKIVCVVQISHKINKLAFGDYFPGAMNPLDRYSCFFSLIHYWSVYVILNKLSSVAVIKSFLPVGATFSVQWIQETPSGMYQYFIKVCVLGEALIRVGLFYLLVL